MRVKEEKAVITFQTTLQAIQAERALQAAGCPGRLIPVPLEITAGCGMAWCTPQGDAQTAEQCLRDAGLDWERTYCLLL